MAPDIIEPVSATESRRYNFDGIDTMALHTRVRELEAELAAIHVELLVRYKQRDGFIVLPAQPEPKRIYERKTHAPATGGRRNYLADLLKRPMEEP